MGGGWRIGMYLGRRHTRGGLEISDLPVFVIHCSVNYMLSSSSSGWLVHFSISGKFPLELGKTLGIIIF